MQTALSLNTCTCRRGLAAAALARSHAWAVCSRIRSSAGSTSLSLYSTAVPDNGKRLYVLDLMPLVYKFLPREPAPAAQQQQPQYPVQPSSPAADFMGMLLNLIHRQEAPPTHLAVVVDVPGATYRRLQYPQYKAQRKEHPPQLVAAIPAILSLVEALGLPVLALPGVEADDVVGSLAVRAAHEGFHVVIVSTDKDFYQLLGPRVCVLRQPPRGPLYGLDQFRAEFGLPDPAQFVDVKALMGDTADNIPGVKGVGAKTALALVQRYGGVEDAFAALAAGEQQPQPSQQQGEQQPPPVKLNKAQVAMLHSEAGRTAAQFAKHLVTINTSLKAPPLREPWDRYELRLPADGGRLAEERAQKLQLHFLYARLQDLFKRWRTAPPQQAAPS